MRWTVYLFLLLKLLQCLSNSHGWVTTTTTTRMLTSTVTTSPAQATTATKTTTVLQGMVNPASFASDDEWHPRDPAFTTPQLLSGVWHQIAQAGTLSKGVSCNCCNCSVAQFFFFLAGTRDLLCVQPISLSQFFVPPPLSLFLKQNIDTLRVRCAS